MLAGPPPRTPPGTIGRQGLEVSKRADRYGDARFGSKPLHFVEPFRLADRCSMTQLAPVRRLAALICSALVVGPGMAAEKVLAPTDKWRVDFADSHCIAQRVYGDAREPVYLHIKASAVGEGLQLSIARPGPNGYGIQEKAKLGFGKAEPREYSQMRFGVEKKQVRMVNLTKSEIPQLSGASELRWKAANLDYVFPLGPMANLVKVLEECRGGLGDFWNGTSEKVAALRQEPTLNKPVVKLFNSNDYPSQAIFADLSGTTKIVGLVDEAGKLVDCTIVETSGVAVLDAQTCIIVRDRGKFSPAIGADGKPTKGVFVQRIRWEMH